MNFLLDPNSIDSYKLFIRAKKMPRYRVQGHTIFVPDEYAGKLGFKAKERSLTKYHAKHGLFDYQRDIIKLAIRKQKYCVFADCGLGKTLIFLEFCRYVNKQVGNKQCILIVSPLMVIEQTIAEAKRFYDKYNIRQLHASNLQDWLDHGHGIGITNYEAIRPELKTDQLGALIIDESSMLKSAYGKWGTKLIEMGKGLRWKLALTGTPAPNDRIEYANHAVFMDAFPTVNSFYARFFVNRGQTNNRWDMKPYAIEPFYRSLSHWCIFLTNPGTYGWKDNSEELPPIIQHIHDIPLTDQQTEIAYQTTGRLFADEIGGITSRSVLSQLAKGNYRGKRIPTNKPQYIRELIDSFNGDSTIIWCLYNEEQKILEETLPEAASIKGSTEFEERSRVINGFKAGKIKTIISKPKILGFGLNLQIATRQVFSGLMDSYESYYQAVKRSNRYGAKGPLHVHIPITDIERPMIETVLAKADRVHEDTINQERIFRDVAERF